MPVCGFKAIYSVIAGIPRRDRHVFGMPIDTRKSKERLK